jgi:glycosyltransferase involved in cell wall biosynthesis
MSRYVNDKSGLCFAADEAMLYLRLFAESRAARQVRVAEARPFAGPYPMDPERSAWQNRLNHVLNRVLWKQHHFNQRVISGAQDALLMPADERSARPLLQVIVPNDVSENTTGGSARMWGLCGSLARHFRVELISVTRWWREPERRSILPGVDLLICSLRGEIDAAIQRAEQNVGRAATFLTMGDPAHPLPMFDGYIRRTTSRAAGVLMVGPFLHARFRALAPDVPLFYDMHDVCRDYVGRMAGAHKEPALQRLDQLERRMLDDCAGIASVSDADAEAVGRLYPGARSKIHLVPNGVSTANVFRSYPSESLALAQGLGFRKPLMLFMGSVLEANIRAMTFIIQHLAPAVPAAQWAILGVSREEHSRLAGSMALPENVAFCGRVPESEKEALFALAALAVAPMGDGTGSSLKIPDYLAHGKPVISTPIGLRGFDAIAPHVEVVSLDDMASACSRLVAQLMASPASLDARAEAAWRLVRDTLDWTVIGDRLMTMMKPHLRDVC